MKTQIKKIIISAAALLFLTSGVSLAGDWDRHHHKRHAKAHAKIKKHHRGWHQHHCKPGKRYLKHYRVHNKKHYRKHRLERYSCDAGFYHWYDRHDGLWKSNHRTYRKHHRYSGDYKRHQRRQHDRTAIVYKLALKDSDIEFKIVAKNR